MAQAAATGYGVTGSAASLARCSAAGATSADAGCTSAAGVGGRLRSSIGTSGARPGRGGEVRASGWSGLRA